MAAISGGEVVDLLRQGFNLPLLSHIANVEVTWIHNVGHHDPLGDCERRTKGERTEVEKKGGVRKGRKEKTIQRKINTSVS